MPYRDIEKAQQETTSEVLHSIDASGPAGAQGREGHRGADGTTWGTHGQPGSAAGPATPGGAGGRIDVTFAPGGASQLVLRGQRTRSERSETIDARIELGESGFVDLIARGGPGGNGGRGGRGGAGANGSPGQHATRYSSGTSGGRGGDGGHGGIGSNGASGGQGGSIRVRVNDEDTALLMVLRQGVEGGAGGAAGVNGAGGSAGFGGPGGHSHSWTTHSRDSKGHTTTHHHSMPGGHPGPPGNIGGAGNAALRPGLRGADGAFVIEVQTKFGVERGASRYHFLLSHVEVHTPDRDGITEPGERIELRNIRLRNAGDLASPRHADVQLIVRTSNWVRPIDGEVLLVPRGVAGGAEVEVPGVLAFELRDYTTTASSDALREREAVLLEAFVPDVQRSFEPFIPAPMDALRTLHIRFPVAASVLETLPSLAPDEMSKLRFAIANQSKAALGRKSDSKRVLRVRIALHESELDDRHAVLIDERGERCNLAEGWVRELPSLESIVTFEGAIGIREGAPTYRALRLRLALELGRLDAPDITRVVQYRDVEIRIGARMAHGDFDWLLVTHHRTTREEIDAWEALARSMHARIAYYDLSLHGELQVDAPFEGGPSIATRLKGGLLIVLGYPMHTPEGPRSPLSLLASNTLSALHAVRADLLLLGGDSSLKAFLTPRTQAPVAEPFVHDGETALVRHLEASRGAQDGHALEAQCVIHEIGFGLETPSEARLGIRANALSVRLTKLFPEREHHVAWDFDPDMSESWAPFRRRRLGKLHVLARAAGRGGAGHVTLSDTALADPAHILSETMRIGVLVSRGFDDRLRVLASMLAETKPNRALVTAVVDALLLGVAGEQLAVVRLTRARQGLQRARLEEGLVRLKALAETRIFGGDLEGEAAHQLARIVASLRFFVGAQTSLWERIPGLAWSRRAAQLRAITEAHLVAFLAHQTTDRTQHEALVQRAAEQLAALEQAWKRAKQNGQRKKDAFARMLLLAPAWGATITTDEELTLEHAGIAEELSALRARHTEAQQRGLLAAQTSEGLDAERARLVLTTKTSALR